jgi:D-alanyl-D-alanine carboxypeptidase
MRYNAGRKKEPDLKPMRGRKRHWALAAAFAGLTLAAAHAAEPSDSDAEIVRGPYLVADAESGQIIEDFDALRPWFPASTTKLMTIYVAFQAIRAGEFSLDTDVRYGANASAQPPSKMGFKPGSTLSLDNALKMMMVKSANDIAVAVAETIGGSVEGFAERMNAAARKLGMTRSHFVNPHGLPDERQVTTARDMALVARALLTEFPEHRPYFAIHAIQIGGKVLRNYNRLIDRYPGATGMKTGFICASGYNLVASARRGDRELVAVVFGEYGGKLRNEHAAALLDGAFEMPQRRTETETTLFNVTSGESYSEPLDMRPYVCGQKRSAAMAALRGEDDDEGDVAVSHLTAPVYLGPPIRVSAYVPADYGEPGFVAPRPRPRPGADKGRPDVLDAFAPLDGGASASPPAEAIGAAAGQPRPLEEVIPE